MNDICIINFPFTENPYRKKQRPALCLTKIIGKKKFIIIAYISSKIKDLTEYDILLDQTSHYFPELGLTKTSVIKLQKITSISSFEIVSIIGKLPEELTLELHHNLKKMFKL